MGRIKKSGIQIAAKKIVQKYQNLARKNSYQRPDKKVGQEVVFLKQVAVYPWDILTRKVRDQFDVIETFDCQKNS